MKVSPFNSYISLSDNRVLGYNSFHRRFIILPQKISKVLQTYDINLMSNNLLHKISPETFQLLKESGFIINSGVDELSILDKELETINCCESNAELHINPTLDCNFRCWYCYEEHMAGSKMSEEVLEAVKNYLNKTIAQPLRHFRLSFFGGEPLLKFDSVCKPLIEEAAGLCAERGASFHTSFTTNSYLLTQDMADYLGRFSCGMQITLDGHREFHNKVRFAPGGIGSYDRIISNVAMLADVGVRVVLRINYTLGNLESVSEIISDLKAQNIVESNKIVIDFQRVWQDNHKGGDEKIKLLIKEYGRQLKEIGISYSLPDLHNPRVSSCYGDKKNYICVNYNGDFYKCTARDFKPERRAGHLAPDGTLVWEPGRREAWEKAKFSREICRSCRIAPICLGGCRQRGLESPDDRRCPLGYDEARKDELILQRFEHQYLND